MADTDHEPDTMPPPPNPYSPDKNSSASQEPDDVAVDKERGGMPKTQESLGLLGAGQSYKNRYK